MSEQQTEQEDQGTKREGMEQVSIVSDPPAGLKTSDVYHVKNIPERFNNPGEYGERERERERALRRHDS